MSKRLAAIMLLASGVGSASAAPYVFTPVPIPPGGTSDGGFGINNAGEIAGTYFDATVHGFLSTGGNFTLLNAPGAYFTITTGISNAGAVTGQSLGSGGSARQGFLYSGGSYTAIAKPEATDETAPRGVNSAGEVVGTYSIFTSRYSPPTVFGFTWTNGAFSPFNVPGAAETDPLGINDRGQIVGTYGDATGVHGFVEQAGVFSTVSVPGADRTIPRAINNAGEIVGSYTLPRDSFSHGFAETGGVFTSFDAPGAARLGTFPTGVNNAGVIIGNYFLPSTDGGNFIATPATPVPEPATAAVIAPALLGLMARRRRRVRGCGPGRPDPAAAARPSSP